MPHVRTHEPPPAFAPMTIARGYLAHFRTLLDRVDTEAIGRAVQRLRVARDAGASVYTAGNGGSAATAAHLASDLVKATKGSGRRPMRVLCLNDNVPWLTALANDEGYERVFTGQLEFLARAGDVLILISASGNSPNLIQAVDFAREREIVTIGLLGFDGGALKDRVDECLWLQSEEGIYGPIESGHAVICDILTTCLMRDVPVDAEAAWR